MYSVCRVFYQLLLKHTNDAEATAPSRKSGSRGKKSKAPPAVRNPRLSIPVKKYDYEVFRRLIQFVHCGATNIDVHTVAGNILDDGYRMV
jgi:hypothetical protein